MRKILLFSILFLGITNSFAQLTCATAITITADGVITSPAITGTFVGTCAPNGNVASPNAMWWKYTATANGEVTLNTDIPQTSGNDDTRVSVFTGTCTTLTCYAGADDIDDINYFTTLTFPVQLGVTYHIAWDDRWSALGFNFDFAFATVPCVGVNASAVAQPTNLTTNSAQLNFGVGVGNPASYDVEYGPAGFLPGAGTVVNTLTNALLLSGLSPASSIFEYYIRNNCGAFQSAYVGPFSLYLAASLPYANNFDSATDNADGFVATGWSLSSSATLSQSPLIFFFSSVSTTAPTNALLYTRAISLQANEQVTLSFYTRLNNVAGSAQTLKVWVNGSLSTTGATQLGADISVSGNTYTLQTRTFTSTTAGTYYFILNNASPAVTTATNMFLDTVSLTSVLGTNDFLSSKFSVYPNPTNNIINFSNNENAVVSSLEMTDMNGRVVKSIKVNATEGQVSINDLANGIYMMKISTDQGVAIKKIVKQ